MNLRPYPCLAALALATTSIVLCGAAPGQTADAATPDFVPLPDTVEMLDGRFHITAKTTIVAPDSLRNEAEFLANRLQESSGLPAPVATSGAGVTLALDSALPAEGYALEIRPDGVAIRGGSAAGAFYGAQTFLQALPPAVYGNRRKPGLDWSAPCLRIADAPATGWRGVMIDSARHFQPKEFILKFLDAMAAQKLNRLHWHLVDSEGWRIEIKKYPKLAQFTKDAPPFYSEEIPTNPTLRARYRYGWPHGGGYYSQDDIREIVMHAAARHITIVPEIEFPAHCKIALASYPEFATTRKGDANLLGVHPEAIGFLKDVLDETMSLFPGEWIHFGGDEAAKDEWKKSPEVQAKIDALGLRINDPKNPDASENALQAWLFNEMAGHVAKRGKKAVGWEEIMHGDNINRLTKNSVIMPWLSSKNGIAAANAGYGVVFTNVNPFYLDFGQDASPAEPNSASTTQPEKLPVHTPQAIHSYDLFPKEIAPENRRNVLGAQCQLWSEYLPRTEDLEYQAFPRACALAELTWTAPEHRKDTNEFMNRLVSHGARLTALGLNHRRIAQPPGPAWTPQSITLRRPWEFALPADIAARAVETGTLKFKFAHKGGLDNLTISIVELREDGKIIATDKHKGVVGSTPRDHAYQLAVPKDAKADKLTLRIHASTTGDDDTAGAVEFE